VDSFYFTVITLTTVGYGDLSPTQPLTKIVTVVFVIVGIGLLATFVAELAMYSIQRAQEGFGESDV
jgi:voltage-gated potassium channel